jgi:hypothetical protein
MVIDDFQSAVGYRLVGEVVKKNNICTVTKLCLNHAE